MTASPTWQAVLDDWAAFLDGLEAALDSGEWDAYADQPAWQPPADVAGELSRTDEGRALALADRAGRLRDRLQGALQRAATEVGTERRKSSGVAAYRGAQRRA